MYSLYSTISCEKKGKLLHIIIALQLYLHPLLCLYTNIMILLLKYTRAIFSLYTLDTIDISNSVLNNTYKSTWLPTRILSHTYINCKQYLSTCISTCLCSALPKHILHCTGQIIHRLQTLLLRRLIKKNTQLKKTTR